MVDVVSGAIAMLANARFGLLDYYRELAEKANEMANKILN
jgi:hypothetical protein